MQEEFSAFHDLESGVRGLFVEVLGSLILIVPSLVGGRIHAMVLPVGSLKEAHLCLHGEYYPLVDVGSSGGQVLGGTEAAVACRVKVGEDIVENKLAVVTRSEQQSRIGRLRYMVDPWNVAEGLHLDVMGIGPPEVSYASVVVVGLV